ncbi:unnamed protein product, partial [marine sediment metagenome]
MVSASIIISLLFLAVAVYTSNIGLSGIAVAIVSPIL